MVLFKKDKTYICILVFLSPYSSNIFSQDFFPFLHFQFVQRQLCTGCRYKWWHFSLQWRVFPKAEWKCDYQQLFYTLFNVLCFLKWKQLLFIVTNPNVRFIFLFYVHSPSLIYISGCLWFIAVQDWSSHSSLCFVLSNLSFAVKFTSAGPCSLKALQEKGEKKPCLGMTGKLWKRVHISQMARRMP